MHPSVHSCIQAILHHPCTASIHSCISEPFYSCSPAFATYIPASLHHCILAFCTSCTQVLMYPYITALMYLFASLCTPTSLHLCGHASHATWCMSSERFGHYARARLYRCANPFLLCCTFCVHARLDLALHLHTSIHATAYVYIPAAMLFLIVASLRFLHLYLFILSFWLRTSTSLDVCWAASIHICITALLHFCMAALLHHCGFASTCIRTQTHTATCSCACDNPSCTHAYSGQGQAGGARVCKQAGGNEVCEAGFLSDWLVVRNAFIIELKWV